MRMVYVGISLLVCVINLLIVPVANVLMKLGGQGKGTEDFSGQSNFLNLETIMVKSYTSAW